MFRKNEYSTKDETKQTESSNNTGELWTENFKQGWYKGAGGLSIEKHNEQCLLQVVFNCNQCIAAKDSIVTIEMLVSGSCTVLY